MASSKCRQVVTCLCPVAIKLCQTEVHAPDHDTWRTVTCDSCGEKFGVGPNRIYESRRSEQDCVRQLEALLAEDHKKVAPHGNCYELPD